MRYMKPIILLTALISSMSTGAQEYNPFKPLGKSGKVLNAYGDKFVEVFDFDTIQRIGTVLFNIKTKRVVKFLSDTVSYKEYSNNSSASRFYSVDPLAYKYFSTSPYVFVLNNPISNVDPDGREVVGVTKGDAKKVQADLNAVFKDEKFNGLRALFTLDKKGLTFNKIDATALGTALKGVTLSTDEQSLVDLVTGTINSDQKHLVEFANQKDNISKKGQDIMSKNLPSALVDPVVAANGGLPASIISAFGGSGLTVEMEKGTYSLLIEGLDAAKSGSDYLNSTTGAYGNNPAGRASTTGHEVFGHGRSLALGRGASAQHADAIRAENLILRVMGFGNIQRDGTSHADRTKVTNPSSLPGY